MAAFPSNVAIWLLRLGQTLLVLKLSHGSGVQLGSTTALQLLPLVCLRPSTGALADCRPKAQVLLAAQLLMTGIAALQATLGGATRSGKGEIVHDALPAAPIAWPRSKA